MRVLKFQNIVYCCAFVFAYVGALDDIIKNEIKTSFEVMNDVLTTRIKFGEDPNGPSFSHLSSCHYFSKKETDLWTFAMVCPETQVANILAEGMIREAEFRYSKMGFEPASRLLQHSFWTYVNYEIAEDVKAAAFYATKDGNTLKVICVGLLWAGLYRDKTLISATQPIDEIRRMHLSPSGVFGQLDNDGLFQLDSLTQKWAVSQGDVLVLTSANLPKNFEQVVQLAVEAADAKLPVSAIVSSLKAYYNFERDGDKIFAAARIR